MPHVALLRPLPALAALALAACGGGGGSNDTTPPADTGPAASLAGIDTSSDPDGIVDLPASVDARIRAVFARYTQLTAPSGERLHFLAQPGVSDELLFRTRGMLRQHLFDVEGTALGADKSATFDAIAEGDTAVCVIADAASYDPSDAAIADFQALFGDAARTVDASAMVMEATPAYLQPAPAIDPTLGATAVIVAERGLADAAPAFALALRAASDAAVLAGTYRPAAGLSAAEVDAAYLALAVDVYYGIWGHDPRGDGTAGEAGEYDFHLRTQMELGDPAGVALIESFFKPTHRYPAYLDTAFAGTFEMAFDPVLPYTHRSRYLERAGLRGMATARINGNALDNLFIGNDAATVFEGRGGNDGIDAGGGNDVLVFSGPQADYIVTTPDPTITRVEDTEMNRDGIDDMRGVTRLQFSDGVLDL